VYAADRRELLTYLLLTCRATVRARGLLKDCYLETKPWLWALRRSRTCILIRDSNPVKLKYERVRVAKKGLRLSGID